MEDQVIVMAQKQLEMLEKIQKLTEKRLKNAPEGILTMSCGNDKKERMYRKTEEKREYLGKDQEKLISQLAQKEYDLQLQRLVRKKTRSLRHFKEHYPQKTVTDAFERMHPAKRKYITPVIIPDDEYVRQWQAVPYQGKRFAEEDETDFYTHRGERVRSKSEIIIADLLEGFKIPYRYEYPYKFEDLSYAIYPDFTVLNVRTRKIFIWEHLGRMTDADYANDAMWKLSMYEAHGYYPGENLLFTMESPERPLKIQDVRRMIEHFLV